VFVGVLVPLVLSAVGIDALLLGIPDSPFVIFDFTQTADGGFEFTAGPGILLIGAGIGLLYGYLRTRARQ
jgi:hypothetical protein